MTFAGAGALPADCRGAKKAPLTRKASALISRLPAQDREI